METLNHEFVSTVSHAWRTPPTSLRGSLGLVLGGAAGEVPLKSRSGGDGLVMLLRRVAGGPTAPGAERQP